MASNFAKASEVAISPTKARGAGYGSTTASNPTVPAERPKTQTTSEKQQMVATFSCIPYIEQTSWLNCGPTCLRMIAAAFGEDPGMAEADKAAGILPGKVITTLELASAAAKVVAADVRIVFISTSPGFNEENMKLPYYQQYNATHTSAAEAHLSEAINQGVAVYQRSVVIHDILFWLELSKPRSLRLALVLLDWDIVSGRRKGAYVGHFVVLIGWAPGRGVVYHNPDADCGDGGPACVMSVACFEEARLAVGTDEDLIFFSAKDSDTTEWSEDQRKRQREDSDQREGEDSGCAEEV